MYFLLNCVKTTLLNSNSDIELFSVIFIVHNPYYDLHGILQKL